MPHFSLAHWSSSVFLLPAFSTLHLSLTLGFITKALHAKSNYLFCQICGTSHFVKPRNRFPFDFG